MECDEDIKKKKKTDRYGKTSCRTQPREEGGVWKAHSSEVIPLGSHTQGRK